MKCNICWKNDQVKGFKYCEICLKRFFPLEKFDAKIEKKKAKKVEMQALFKDENNEYQ